MNSNQKPVNAWMYIGDDAPSGTNYNDPTSCYQSLIRNKTYNYLDILFLGFFTSVDITGSDYMGFDIMPGTHPGGLTNQDYLSSTLTDARAINSSLPIVATIGYNSGIYSNIFKSSGKVNAHGVTITDEMCATQFAKNVGTFLTTNKMDGVDLDWEWPIQDEISTARFTILINALRTEFDSLTGASKYYITISPASYGTMVADTVNTKMDLVNLQLYGNSYIGTTCIQNGIDKSLLAYGAKFESIGNGDVVPYQTAKQAYDGYNADDYKAGITQWRVNSGDFAFEQAQQMILFELMHGPKGNSFDDMPIVTAATDPSKTPNAPQITSLNIRFGDVLNAIQVNNSVTFINPENQPVVLDYNMPMHGGDSGTAAPEIVLDSGDYLVGISGYTGVWFGWDCVLQISFTTKNGKVYGPYGSMNNASSKVAFTSPTPPSGHAIVAFSGKTVNVPLASGPNTDIIASIDVSFAEA